MKYLLYLSILLIFTACPNDDDSSSNGDQGNDIAALNWLEEEAAHKWSRYHSYDDSYMYYILKGDRTACYFEITSSGSRINNRCYTYWLIDEEETRNIEGAVAYALEIEGSGLTSFFSFVNNKIYKGGYDNLGMFPATTSRICECN